MKKGIEILPEDCYLLRNENKYEVNLITKAKFGQSKVDESDASTDLPSME